jgi:hypothetical protein
MSPDDKRATPGQARLLDQLLEGCPDVPPAARDRPAAALIPLFGSNAVVWTTGIAQLPRREAVELLTWMAQARIVATLVAW